MGHILRFYRTTHNPDGSYKGDKAFGSVAEYNRGYVHFLDSSIGLTLDQIVADIVRYNADFPSEEFVAEPGDVALALIRLVEAGFAAIGDTGTATNL